MPSHDAKSRKEITKRFGENLRRIREDRGLSQEALADLSDLHRTEVSLLERAGREPRLSTLAKIAAVLEVPLSDLFDGVEWEPPNLEHDVRPATSGGRFRVKPKAKQLNECPGASSRDF